MNNSLNYIRYHMNRDRNFLILYGIALLCLFPLLALALKTILPPKDSVIVMLILLGDDPSAVSVSLFMEPQGNGSVCMHCDEAKDPVYP